MNHKAIKNLMQISCNSINANTIKDITCCMHAILTRLVVPILCSIEHVIDRIVLLKHSNVVRRFLPLISGYLQKFQNFKHQFSTPKKISMGLNKMWSNLRGHKICAYLHNYFNLHVCPSLWRTASVSLHHFITFIIPCT